MAAYDAGNVAWWVGALGGALSDGASGGNDDDGVSGPADGGVDPAAVGAERVQQWVNYYGDSVVATGQNVTVAGLGSTDVDVELSDGSFIEVGGPGKAINPSAFRRQLQILQAYAESKGGTAQFLYAEGTPQSVINQAAKRLGADNVRPIP